MSRPLNVAASPVIFKDKFLLLRRKKEPYKNFWSLPGGKIEFGEDLKKAMLREIYEEAGIKAKFLGLRGVVYETLIDGKQKDHFIIWVCETKASSQSVKHSGEGEVSWFSQKELRQIKHSVIPSDFRMIEKFFLKKNSSKLKLHHSTMIHKKGKYSLKFFG